ncbi:DUF411 domain-containing protein [Caenispirillum bisanense]|uniref:DUF411 domain-containing protein n=1 Tax=Caenispirillum bisanense TaxID=414052 RepID=UPI0031CDD32D
MITRRTVVMAAAAVAVLGAGVLALGSGGGDARAADMEVWKSPSCGCCGGWIDHMKAEGFSVIVHDLDDVTPVKDRLGVEPELASCHTAVIDGYVIEGHVPASDVRRLLAERPKATGLTIPGMPQSAPGMDMPGEPYEVLLFSPGGTSLFSRHAG